ncbi:MAG: bifunctional UDP-N-acetylglucosamine diphosphorylase/glucosamine-1-phosphate N-acetyltransferase GlmU [Oscillospiraceae bacterium]
MNKGEKAVILAGGQGKRMKSELPKALLSVLEKPMLRWVTDACEAAGLSNLCVVKGFGAEKIDDYLDGRYQTVLQAERLGTGHAVMQTADFLREGGASDTLLLNGDAPFIDAETILGALAQHRAGGYSVTVVTSEVNNPHGYGRILRDGDFVTGIVEETDCTQEQRAIREINSGCYWFDTEALLEALDKLTPANAQGEYYLTDCLGLIIGAGLRAGAFLSPNPDVVLGANDRRGLLELNDIARRRVIDKHLDNGVEFTCTEGVVISPAVKIGAGTRILSGVVLRGTTLIGENCVIGPNCVIKDALVGARTVLNNVQAEECEICADVKMGPFVNIRPGSVIKSFAKIGDFVEIKNSTVGEGTAVSHLTYIGDSDVGENVNFGCGVVTVNYDGEQKFRTAIGNNAFIGCNTNLIAPVKIGNGAYTAAGSTVTGEIPDNALVIERGKQVVKEGYAARKLRTRTEKYEKTKSQE